LKRPYCGQRQEFNSAAMPWGLSNQEVTDVMNYIMGPGTTKKVCALKK
jgi:uncharacterized protein YcgI (DUF1989 family)